MRLDAKTFPPAAPSASRSCSTLVVVASAALAQPEPLVYTNDPASSIVPAGHGNDHVLVAFPRHAQIMTGGGGSSEEPSRLRQRALARAPRSALLVVPDVEITAPASPIRAVDPTAERRLRGIVRRCASGSDVNNKDSQRLRNVRSGRSSGGFEACSVDVHAASWTPEEFVRPVESMRARRPVRDAVRAATSLRRLLRKCLLRVARCYSLVRRVRTYSAYQTANRP
jgi:hypothetical protein